MLNNPHRIATDDFDLSIVSNSYSKGVLEIFNREMLVAKKTSILRHIKFSRECKYTERGIIFMPNIDKYDIYDNHRNMVIQMSDTFKKRKCIVIYNNVMSELLAHR